MLMISENRKARYDFLTTETFEAGLVLKGTEVKSLRKNKASLGEVYISESNGEMWAHNLYVEEYSAANRFNHDPKRLKKLLLHRSEINRLLGKVKKDNSTIIMLSMYFNEHGKVKAKIALVKGKKKHDKREAIKQRDWERAKNRINLQ